MLCENGCNQEAFFQTKGGRYICCKSSNSCPENKRKNSEGLKLAFQEGRKDCSQFDGKRGRNKGLVTADFCYDGKGNHKQFLIVERGRNCERCKLANWLNVPITLELEHIDGNTRNNAKDNLELLCPNCHAQTPTWRKRKCSGNGARYTEDAMVEAIISSENMHQALLKLDLKWGSSSTLMKIKDKLDLKFKSPGGEIGSRTRFRF